MGFLDFLFGRKKGRPADPPGRVGAEYGFDRPGSSDLRPGPPPIHDDETSEERRRHEEAIARYRYMLRTAPPEDVERAHAEAFAQLTPEQRRTVLERLAHELPDAERPRSDDPYDLARATTRGEFRQPGFAQRAFGGTPLMGAAPGMGGFGGGLGGGMMGGLGGSLLGGLAMGFVGSSIANMFFHNPAHAAGFAQAAQNGEFQDLPAYDPAADSAIPTFDQIDPYGDPADAAGGAGGDVAAQYDQDPLGDPGAGYDFGSIDGGDFGGDL